MSEYPNPNVTVTRHRGHTRQAHCAACGWHSGMLGVNAAGAAATAHVCPTTTEERTAMTDTTRIDCPICGGDGYLNEPVRDTRSTGTTTRCPGCDGTGRVTASPLPAAEPRDEALELVRRGEVDVDSSGELEQLRETIREEHAADGGEPLDEQRRRLPDTPPLDAAAIRAMHADASPESDPAHARLVADRARRANDRIADELEAPGFAAALTAVEAITDTHSQLALVLVELERVNAELEELRALRPGGVVELARRCNDLEAAFDSEERAHAETLAELARVRSELERCQLGDYPPPVS